MLVFRLASRRKRAIRIAPTGYLFLSLTSLSLGVVSTWFWFADKLAAPR